MKDLVERLISEGSNEEYFWQTDDGIVKNRFSCLVGRAERDPINGKVTTANYLHT